MTLTIVESLYFALPTALAVIALAAGVLLWVRAHRGQKPVRRRLLGGAFVAVFGLIVASMATPCVYQSFGHYDDLDFCAPQIAVTVNPYFSLAWLLRRLAPHR